MTAAEIARALNGRRYGRNWLIRCPAHEDRSPSCSIAEGRDGVVVHCFAGCDPRDVIAELRDRGLWDAANPKFQGGNTTLKAELRRSTPGRGKKADSNTTGFQDNDARRIAFARRIWRESHDPRGTLAERYLNSRELDLDDELAGRVLRFHPACPWGANETRPCLVAAFNPFRSVTIGEIDDEAPPVAIHRIALTADGEKIGKRMLGPVAGCAVKLDHDADVTLGLGICEGIETGLAVRAIGWRPVWALGSAGAIRRFAPLAGIESLTIFADNDAPAPSEWRHGVDYGVGTGETAARECALRWQVAGRHVEIVMPRAPGCDWADEWGVR